jgi:NAD(P)H-dependent FMN reductase
MILAMGKKILGIVGSYRKGGVIDALVSEVLAAAQEGGAQTEKIYLLDKHIEFCTNCRACTQDPGTDPPPCVLHDDMGEILTQCRQADGLVLGAPVNFFNVNALTRRFMERLVCFAYWPWNSHKGPVMRTKARDKKAVLITATAMPAILGRFFTGAPRALKLTAQTLGARPVATVFVGMIAQQQKETLPERARQQARQAGRKLAASLPGG